MNGKRRLPPVGMRIIKSAVAILLCYMISFLRGNAGIVFYSHIAALWCIQVYRENTIKNAVQRITGTVIGAIYGLAYLLADRYLMLSSGIDQKINVLLISLMIIAVIYTTVLINKKQASYLSCVVFLSIVVNHSLDVNPYLFVWNRFLDTLIGILVGVFVNCIRLPRKRNQDVLYISGLDNTLLTKEHKLTDYSKIELNRLLAEGANFTISTVRTPAFLIDTLRDVRLRLPIIAMDGAVLYDIENHTYLKVYVISCETSKEILALAQTQGLYCHTNVIMDDMLVIYYEETGDAVQQRLVETLRRSPYRNYVRRKPPMDEEVVYFMLLYPREQMEAFYLVLKERGYTKDLKVQMYDSEEHPGYTYIKIFNKNASKENMIAYLKEQTGLTKTVTFGSDEQRYDVCTKGEDMNQVVHELQRLYEPLAWKADSGT